MDFTMRHILNASAKGIASLLLALILMSQLLPFSASAEYDYDYDFHVSEAKQIAGLFSDLEPAKEQLSACYDEDKFLMKSRDMALLIARHLGEDDWGYQVIYDDSKSTATEQKYMLMRNDATGKNDALMTVGIHMSVNRKDEVLGVAISVDPTSWEDAQLKTVIRAMADIYCILNTSMTPEQRQQLITARNVAVSDDGYKAYGFLNGLYYEFTFSSQMVSAIIRPMAYEDANLASVLYHFTPKTISYDDKDVYAIRTTDLFVTPQGDICLDLELVNNSNHPLLFDLIRALAGDYSLPLSVYTVVGAGNTKKVQLSLNSAILMAAGLESFDSIRVDFTITDQETQEHYHLEYGWIEFDMFLHTEDNHYASNIKLFENDDFTLTLIGSALTKEDGRPHMVLHLDHIVYFPMRVLSEGNCVVGKQEYDLYANHRVTKVTKGFTPVSPFLHSWNKTGTLEFYLNICNDYSKLVSGPITVKMDASGKVLSASAKMKEVDNYDDLFPKPLH